MDGCGPDSGIRQQCNNVYCITSPMLEENADEGTKKLPCCLWNKTGQSDNGSTTSKNVCEPITETPTVVLGTWRLTTVSIRGKTVKNGAQLESGCFRREEYVDSSKSE